MKFSKTTRGNKVLIYQGHDYCFFRKSNNSITWRCRKHHASRCHSFVRTNEECDLILEEPTSHSHDSEPQKSVANIIKVNMKEQMNNIFALPVNVLGESLQNVSTEILIQMPKKTSLLRFLRKNRHHDEANTSNIHFEIPEKYNSNILYDSGINDSDRIIAFGDRDLLQELTKDIIIGDGTFDKSPSYFYQLYTWHARIGNSYPPCIYFLLTKKTTETYLRMFQILKNLLPNLSPRYILVDFERACINAAQSEFPTALLKGCYFHLAQSLNRKIKSVGLQCEYESNIATRILMKSLLAISLIPPTEVRNVFHILAPKFPDDEKYHEILTYFNNNYIEGIFGRSPLFDISLWNHFDSVTEKSPKTTNCCEGFHNSLNSIFQSSHPTIFSLFDGLKRDVAVHRLTLANVLAGKIEVKKKKFLELHEALSNLVLEYNFNGSDDEKFEFLKRIASLQ